MTSPVVFSPTEPSMDPIWLLIRFNGRELTFELPATGNRTIVVGSTKGADVAIAESPPVGFFVERHQDGLCLIPGYEGNELRIDTKRFEALCHVDRRAVVQLGELRLEVEVMDNPPTERNCDAGKPQDETPTNVRDSGVSSAVAHTATTTEFSRLAFSVALRQHATKSHTREELLQPSPFPTKTLEMGPIDFSHWPPKDDWPELDQSEGMRQFETASKSPPPRPRELPKTPGPAEADAPKVGSATPQVGRHPQPPSPTDGCKTNSKGASPRPVESPKPPRPRPSKSTELRLTTTLPRAPFRARGDTTEFERPLLSPTNGPPLSAAPVADASQSLDDSHRAVPVDQGGAANPARRPILVLLERLGMVTRRYPVRVIAAAAIGSMALSVLLFGVSRLVVAHHERLRTKTGERLSPSADMAKASATTQPTASRIEVPLPQQQSATIATSTAPAGLVAEDPQVALAVGHLVAGRLVEAEQAYRELGERHPEQPAYASSARILARRNSSDCRATNHVTTKCPMVKP